MNAKTHYVLTHWGERGPVADRLLTCADPTTGELVELGELVQVVYRTVKGGDRGVATDYEHAFKRPLPVLAYTAAGLVICGGGYHVGIRGIVG